MKHLFTRLILTLSLALAGALPAFAAGMSNYLENKVGDYIFRAQAWTQPTTLCVGLATASIADTTTGATVTEAAYTGYARGQLNASYSAWKGTGDEVTNTGSAGTDGTISNASAITIGSAASSGPTVVTHFFLADSCTAGAGNILFYGALGTSKTINNGDPAPSFAIDSATFQMDN